MLLLYLTKITFSIRFMRNYLNTFMYLFELQLIHFIYLINLIYSFALDFFWNHQNESL